MCLRQIVPLLHLFYFQGVKIEDHTGAMLDDVGSRHELASCQGCNNTSCNMYPPSIHHPYMRIFDM